MRELLYKSTTPTITRGVDWFNPITRGLLVYYPTLEGFGESTTDACGFNHTAANTTAQWSTSGASYVPGNGKALLFNGTNGSPVSTGLQGAANINFGSGQACTLSCWYKNILGTYYQDPFLLTNAGGAKIYIERNSGTAVLFGAHPAGGSYYYVNSTYNPTPSATNPFVHIVGVLLPTTPGTNTGITCSIYINGQLNATATGLQTAAMAALYPSVGSAIGLTNQQMAVANCAAWNRALSAAEVAEMYENPYGMLKPPMYRQMFRFGAIINSRRSLSGRVGTRRVIVPPRGL